MIRRIAGGIVAVTLWTQAVAIEHGEYADVHPTDQITLHDVIAAALAQAPQTHVLSAKAGLAAAWQRRAGSLIGDTPSLSLRYQSDRWQDDLRLSEYEAGLELPLWWPGERRLTRSLAAAHNAESDLAARALQWEVAGQVRGLLWAMVAAEDELRIAEHSLTVSDQLRGNVERRYQAGDVPRTDLMLAQTHHLEAQAVQLRAAANLRDAQVSYAMYTGLEVRPATLMEGLSTTHETSPDHPAIALAAQRIRRAEAERSRVRKSARGSPMLMLGPRRERPQLADEFEDSVGITLTIPIGGTAHSGTAVADATSTVAAARTDLDQLRRSLALALHDAQHELEVVKAGLELAERSAQLYREQARSGLLAYEAGEIDLMDLLKMQGSALEAEGGLSRLQTRHGMLIARFNQTVGELP